MFEDSLVESTERLVRGNLWTTTISFASQAALLAGLLLLSLLYPDALPMRTLISSLEAPPSSPPAPVPVQPIRTTARTTEIHSNALRVPTRIPDRIAIVRDEPTETGGPPISPVVPCCAPDGSGNNPITRLLDDAHTTAPRVVPPPKVRVSSGVAQGMLVRQVKPQYPPLALQARIQGTVVLQAVIGKDGSVEELHAVSGPPLLIGAAIAAVRQWLYRPYYLNGEPVAVDTQINVNFTLASE
jgi:periplasmic protein TonB